MRIVIVGMAFEAGQTRVSFDCDCGSGAARWDGPGLEVGDERFVELSLDGVRTVGEDMLDTAEPIGLTLRDGLTVLVGEVRAIDEEGFAELDLGCGGVDVEIAGALPGLHRRYRLVAAELAVFDCNF
ncbi:hypothetical protein [Chondromyces crocatus]|nr:hypothetical protein [Chondromyces crocatus]